MRTRVQVNDVLVCITGALTGNVALVDQELNEPAFVNQHVALVRCKTKIIEPRFLAYVLHSECGKRQFKTNEYGGTKQGLGLGDVKNVFVVVPSLEEQRGIVSKLDGEIQSFQEAISHLNHEIDLLREYRIRLVADVVTGKLDVREAAAALPVDDTPLPLEPDALDADTDTDDEDATEAELND